MSEEKTYVEDVNRTIYDVIDDDRTRIRMVEGADNLQQGGLASTTGTHDTHDLSSVDMEVNAFQHLQRAKALGNILNVNHNFSLITFHFLFSCIQRKIVS